MASYNEAGKPAGNTFSQPFELKFVPTKAVKDLIPKDEPSDHMAYVKQLS